MAEQFQWLISLAEIAVLAQVKRPVPSNWARRHDDFPQPVSREGGRALFDGREIIDWLLETGHGNADQRRLRGELALHTLASWRGRLPGRLLVDALTSLICLRSQLDTPLAPIDWNQLLEQASRADFEDAYLLAELRALPEAFGPDLVALADELVEAAYTPAEALEWVLEARPRLGEPMAEVPSPLLTVTLAKLSGIGELDDGGIVATPYARSGELLVALHAQAKEEAGHSYLAADPDRASVRLVRRRMFVRQVYDFQLGVAEGPELDIDDWGDPHIVLCVLPYEPSETRDAVAVLEQVQALTDLLRPDRTAVVLGPADVLVGPLAPHGDADLLRRSFLTDGLLKVVACLPRGAFSYWPQYRTAVWVLTRQQTGLVFLSDLSDRPLSERALGTLVEDVQVFRAAGWRIDRRHAMRHGVIVPIKELDDQPGVAFTPQQRPPESRYIRPVVERPVRISELEIRLEELLAQRNLSDGPALRTYAALRPEGRPVQRTTIGRMLKERRLRLLPGHRIAPEHLISGGDHPVLTPAEITGDAPVGGRTIDRLVFASAYEHAKFTRPGDIVVTPDFGVYVDAEGLSVVAHPARILRVRPGAERPVRSRVLAALLRAAGTLYAARRLEDLSVPDLAPDEAERYDTLLTEIEQRAALLRRQTATLDELTRLTAAGLVDGTLTILPSPETT